MDLPFVNVLCVHSEVPALFPSPAAFRTGPLGPPTLTPTLAAGGHGLNIIPEHATVSVDYRVTTPGSEGVSEDVEEVVPAVGETVILLASPLHPC